VELEPNVQETGSPGNRHKLGQFNQFAVIRNTETPLHKGKRVKPALVEKQTYPRGDGVDLSATKIGLTA